MANIYFLSKIIRASIYILLFANLISCQKDTVHSNSKIEENFFKLPKDANPVLNRLIAHLKKQNENNSFVEDFVKANGYPIWDKAKIILPTQTDYRSNIETNQIEATDSLIVIPTVIFNYSFVKSILAVKLNSDIFYKLFDGDNYATYGFTNDPGKTEPNATDIAASFMQFEKKIFHTDIFKIKDNRLFDFWPAGTIKPEEFILKNESNTTDCAPLYLCSSPDGITWYPIFPLQIIAWECPDIDITAGGGGGVTIYTNGSGNVGSGGWTSQPSPGGGGSSGGNSGSTTNSCARGWVRVAPSICLPELTVTLESVVNNLNNPCITDVLNEISNTNSYSNSLTSMLNTFANSETINITFEPSTSLSNDVFGNTHSPNGDDNYVITLNTNVVPKCSKETITTILFHEAIHAYLKSHINEFDWTNNSEHSLMLQHYFIQLTNALREIFPNLPEKDAWCICFQSILVGENDPPISQMNLNQFRQIYLQRIVYRFPDLNSESAVINLANQYTDTGTLGTRDPNCQ